ncbi:Fur family transcriptional regulator [Nitrincola iocasae]|uniref:Transcriptional repressor n=1 Tax=Nitrincola iocasae TaxID=2614693 RepID=A0A5J6L9J1_9GAMM|nr:Fur family transcriptional regulator [Nitrincola iocasae]QEW05036.1 transcriptional repressor [Nitrincola iocasae]
MPDKNTTFVCANDHQHCIDEAMSSAKALCREQQLRLTPVRELVLRLIWQNHKPLGAYDLLPALADAGFNSAPPTVYRALEFLQEQGLVHRLASLNAYMGCSHPGKQHSGCFFICERCHQACEVDAAPLQAALKQQSQSLGFSITRETIEVLGICPECQQGNPQSHV